MGIAGRLADGQVLGRRQLCFLCTTAADNPQQFSVPGLLGQASAEPLTVWLPHVRTGSVWQLKSTGSSRELGPVGK